jgi:hypothetical protein
MVKDSLLAVYCSYGERKGNRDEPPELLAHLGVPPNLYNKLKQ